MIIYADGSGKGKYGFVSGNTTKTFEKENITNNEAEYLAVLEALKWVEDKRNVIIRSDSRLMINQLKHEWHIKEDRLRDLAMKIWKVIDEKKLDVEFEWIPRRENKAGKLLG